MIFTLLAHRWKDYMRSQAQGMYWLVVVFGVLGLLMFVAMAAGMGILISPLLREMYPEGEVIYRFCGYLFYYYAADVFLRFLSQDLPSHAIQPYLLQNIKRRTLANFICINSLLAIGILAQPLFIWPFVIMEIMPAYGIPTALVFMLTTLSVTLSVHFGVLYIKRKIFVNPLWLAGFVACVGALGGADYMGWLSIREISARGFLLFVNHAWLSVVPISFAVITFYSYYQLMVSDMYFGQDAKKQTARVQPAAGYKFFDQFGQVGEMLALEVKMVIRNKRPRYMLLSYLPLLAFYTYSNYAGDIDEHIGGVVGKAIFLTSLPLLIFGQYMFAWQSEHFDGTMTSRISLPVYIKGKLIVLYAIIVFITLLLSGFGFIDWRIIPIQIAASLFNAGITSIFLVFIATYHFTAVDLDSAKRRNQQEGIWMRLLMMLGLGATWAFLYLPFHVFDRPWWGIAAMSIAGLFSLLFINKWVGVMVDEFNMRRYKIMDGFRDK